MEMAQRQHLRSPQGEPDLHAAMMGHGNKMAPNPPSATVVFATEYVSETFSAALSASGAQVEGFRPDRVKTALSDEAVSCVILWQDPVQVVATAMEAGQDLVEVTEAWLTSTRNVLGLFSRNRRRLLLVDARVLAPHAPEAERDALRVRLHLEALVAPVDKPAEPAIRLAQLLASLVLPQISSIRKCLDELEAGSLSLAPRNFSVADLTAAAGTFKQISEEAEEKARTLAARGTALKEATGRVEALEKSLAQTKAEAVRLEVLKEENTLLKSQVDLQQKEVERILEEHQFASLASEKSLARALADLRTEAKSRAKLQKERDSLARDTEKLTRKLDQVFASASWKVTKPLRKIKLRLFGGELPADEALAKDKLMRAKR